MQSHSKRGPADFTDASQMLGASAVLLQGRILPGGTGPGMPEWQTLYTDDEPWSKPKDPARYIPLQVQEGDYALFLRDQAIEVEFEEKKYLVVPQSAILMLVRDELHEEIG